MEAIYEVKYTGGGSCYGESSELFIASSEEDAVEQLYSWAEDESIDIQGKPTAQQTLIEAYHISPEGVYGPRPRFPEENDILMTRPTVGCCRYFAKGECNHEEPCGDTGSEPGSEPAE